jgi:hypothetical protein
VIYAANLEDRLQTLLQYTPDVSLASALQFLREQDEARPECRCEMEFPIGSCPAHPWRGTYEAP